MAKQVSCYKCGFDYARKEFAHCPKCGEVKVFRPELHDPDYDIFSDVSRNSKQKVLVAVSLLILFAALRLLILK